MPSGLVGQLRLAVIVKITRRGDRGLPRRFFRASAKKVGVAWQTAVGSDLALPEVVGPRSLSMRITNAYLDRVMTVAETDPTVAGRFMRVIGMIDPPAALLRPTMLLRIALANRSQPTGRRVVEESGDRVTAGRVRDEG